MKCEHCTRKVGPARRCGRGSRSGAGRSGGRDRGCAAGVKGRGRWPTGPGAGAAAPAGGERGRAPGPWVGSAGPAPARRLGEPGSQARRAGRCRPGSLGRARGGVSAAPAARVVPPRSGASGLGPTLRRGPGAGSRCARPAFQNVSEAKPPNRGPACHRGAPQTRLRAPLAVFSRCLEPQKRPGPVRAGQAGLPPPVPWSLGGLPRLLPGCGKNQGAGRGAFCFSKN